MFFLCPWSSYLFSEDPIQIFIFEAIATFLLTITINNKVTKTCMQMYFFSIIFDIYSSFAFMMFRFLSANAFWNTVPFIHSCVEDISPN